MTIQELETIRTKISYMRPISDHEVLRSMNLEERIDWMKSRYRYVMDLITIKADGHLVAMGTEAEYEAILARFLMWIAREPNPVRKGYCG